MARPWHEPGGDLDISGAIGPPLDEVMRDLLRSYGDERVSEAVAAYPQHYGETGFLASTPYPGIGKSLETVKQGPADLSGDVKAGDVRAPHSGPMIGGPHAP